MLQDLPQKNLRELSKEFQSRKSIEEQFIFWDQKLKQPYIVFLFVTSSYHDFAGTPKQVEVIQEFQDFQINPLTKQFEEYNKKLIEQYVLYHKKMRLKPLLKQVDMLQHEYYEVLKKAKASKNKEAFIDDYLRRINTYLTKLEKLEHNSEDLRPFYYLTGYRKKLSGKKLDLNSRIYEFHELVFMINGYAIAEFKIFLQNELKGKKQSSKVTPFSMRQRLIALHYLGTLQTMDAWNTSDIQRADFVSSIITRSNDNIRIQFTKRRKLIYSKSEDDWPQIRRDLIAVRKAFEKLEASDIVQRIDNDLQRIGGD